LNVEIEYGPAQSWMRVGLKPGDAIQAEAGAMVRHSPGVEIDTRLNSGRRAGFFRKVLVFLTALLRKLFGGETMFINEFTAPSGGEVVLAPVMSGTIQRRTLREGERLFVQTGSYLASTGDIDTQLRWGGLRALFGGEGLILLECAGNGELFINSYGGITAVDVEGNGRVIEDDALEFPLADGQYLMLGDNSAASKDSRLWLDGHHVDRRLLIGKALVVFWPHAVPASWSLPLRFRGWDLRLPSWPNFGRMRFVR